MSWKHPSSCLPGVTVIVAIGRVGQQPMPGHYGGMATLADPKPVTLGVHLGKGHFAVVAIGDADAVLRTDVDVIAWRPLPKTPHPDDIEAPVVTPEEIIASASALSPDERRAKYLGE